MAPSAAPRLRWACLKRIFRRDNENGSLLSVSPGGFTSKRSVGNPRACAGLGGRIEIGAPHRKPKGRLLEQEETEETEVFLVRSPCSPWVATGFHNLAPGSMSRTTPSVTFISWKLMSRPSGTLSSFI